MWNSIASLKENLNKIALDVHGSDDEIEFEDSSVSDRRNSHSFAQSKSVSRSSGGNMVELPHGSEFEQYKAEIKRLQESEAGIKALSVNYAALLKEKEEQISRLNGENNSLKQNLNATNSFLNASRNGGFRLSTNSQNTPKVKRSSGNQMHNGIVSEQDGLSNGISQPVHPDAVKARMEKELADLLEEKNKSLEAEQATYESQIKQVRLELEKEHNTSANLQLKLQGALNLNGSLQEELISLKRENANACTEMEKLNSELNEKLSEISRLQTELNRRDDVNAVESLKRVIMALEKDNANLKTEKDKLESALKISRSVSPDVSSDVTENSIMPPSTLNEKVHSQGSFPGKEELEVNVQKLEKELKEARRERDKAALQLSRLKQHLLDKESEDSEKMDEDSKIIEELRANNGYLRAQISQLEKALKQAISSQEEIKMTNHRELQMSKDTIDNLNKKLGSCLSTIDAKNVELLNLQTALGQYYAEIEAKEHLERDCALAREESAKLSDLLKNADQQLDISKREKEEVLAKLSHTERTIAEGKARVDKLEEDNAKLHRALEQSMTRLNRMSMDSDYFVDRRIVIKLLVTYFQRNHSKEVLDLMVRMLGFSDEDKQRIGVAQHGSGKGVVRGVLGLPGRLVGGILGGSSSEGHPNMASDNQSFADQWVDFLLKESEERERREAMAAKTEQKEDPHRVLSSSPNQNLYSPVASHGNSLQSVHSESEFSTVPLSSSESSSQVSRLSPKH